MPIEPITAAAAAGLAAHYLGKAGDAAAGKAGQASAEAAGKLLNWMRARLTGRAREALEDLEKAPDSELNRADLEKQLAKALAADPSLAEELRKLVPAEAIEAGGMVQVVTGDGAKGVQIKGSGNKTMLQ